MLKYVVVSSLLAMSSILATTSNAYAERMVTAAVDESSGFIYRVDLDERSEYETDAGWRHVRFWLNTKGDPYKHSAIASCTPYDVKSEYYGWDWRPKGGGYSAGTLAGDIARVACNQ